MPKNRDEKLDMLKGVLILLVVIGHYQKDIVHDIIFLFHMPCFFMISGYLFNETSFSAECLKKWVKRYLVPYFAYSVLILLVLDRNFSILHILSMIWGGRAIGGTYWYITSLLFALCFFLYFKQRFSERVVEIIIFIGG